MSDSDVEHCLEVANDGDPVSAMTTVFVPVDARPGLLVLQAFDVELTRIPGLVNEPQLRAIRYQWWRDTVKADSVDHPVGRALFDVRTRHDVSIDDLTALIDAHSSGDEAAQCAALSALMVKVMGGEDTDCLRVTAALKAWRDVIHGRPIEVCKEAVSPASKKLLLIEAQAKRAVKRQKVTFHPLGTLLSLAWQSFRL